MAKETVTYKIVIPAEFDELFRKRMKVEPKEALKALIKSAVEAQKHEDKQAELQAALQEKVDDSKIAVTIS